MDVKAKIKDVAQTTGEFAAGVAGLGVGTVAMNMVPASVPSYVRGALGIGLAYLAYSMFGKKSDYIKAGAIGLGAAGTLDLAKQLTNGKTGILGMINSKLPSLSGVGSSYFPEGGIPNVPMAGLMEDRLNYSLGSSPTEKLLAA